MEKLEDRINAEYKQLEEGFIQSEQKCMPLIKALRKEWYTNRILTYASGSVAAGSAGVGIYELATNNYMLAAFQIFFTALCGSSSYRMNKEAKEARENLRQAAAYFEKSKECLKNINQILDDSRRQLENGRTKRES